MPFFRICVIFLGFSYSTLMYGEGRTIDDSAELFVQLLASKKYTKIVDEFYVKNVKQYKRLFPESAQGLRPEEIREDIAIGRNAFKFDTAVRYKESKIALSEWEYNKTFYTTFDDDDVGAIVISLVKVTDGSTDRLDIFLQGDVENESFVLYGNDTIDFERLWGLE